MAVGTVGRYDRGMSNSRQVERPIRRCVAAPRLRRGFWFAPLAAGLMLVFLGLLIYWRPQVLALIVSFVFIFAGLTLVTVGWQMKSRIVYRKVEFGPRPPDPPA